MNIIAATDFEQRARHGRHHLSPRNALSAGRVRVTGGAWRHDTQTRKCPAHL